MDLNGHTWFHHVLALSFQRREGREEEVTREGRRREGEREVGDWGGGKRERYF